MEYRDIEHDRLHVSIYNSRNSIYHGWSQINSALGRLFKSERCYSWATLRVQEASPTRPIVMVRELSNRGEGSHWDWNRAHASVVGVTFDRLLEHDLVRCRKVPTSLPTGGIVTTPFTEVVGCGRLWSRSATHHRAGHPP